MGVAMVYYHTCFATRSPISSLNRTYFATSFRMMSSKSSTDAGRGSGGGATGTVELGWSSGGTTVVRSSRREVAASSLEIPVSSFSRIASSSESLPFDQSGEVIHLTMIRLGHG
jgi:hypothetical protein